MLLWHRVFALVLCLALLVVLPACTPEPLRLKLNPGDKRVIEVTNNLTTTMNAMGSTQRNVNRDVARVVLTVESVDAAGVATVKAKVENADLGMEQVEEMMGGLSEMMEGLADEEEVDFELGDLDLTMQIAADGKVQSVSGMAPVAEEMSEKVKEAMEAFLKQVAKQMAEQMGPQAVAAMRKQGDWGNAPRNAARMIKEQLSDEVAKDLLQGLFIEFPEEPVKTGESWVAARIVSHPFPMTVTTTYTVAARGEGATNIDFQSKVTNSPSASGEWQGVSVKMNAAGEITGSFQVDDATGWITSGNRNVDLSIDMDAGGMSVPIRLEGSVHLGGSEG